jgi:hypothetical protein
MSAKHTPGPWKQGSSDEDACVVYSSDDHIIAGCEGIDFDEGTENANARLIAAAPELLEALELAEATGA